jgi:hypothetical protein
MQIHLCCTISRLLVALKRENFPTCNFKEGRKNGWSLVIFVHSEYSLLILSLVKVLLVDFTFQIQPFLYYYLLMHMNYAMYACIRWLYMF